MAYFQRMKSDDSCGLNYEYMGYAEYEFGSTKEARIALGKSHYNGTLTAFVAEVKNRTMDNPMKVYIFCDKDDVNQCREYVKNFSNKGVFGHDDDKTVAWMHVYTHPFMLMLRPETDAKLADKFLAPVIDAIRCGDIEI